MEIIKDESGHRLKLTGRLDIRQADKLQKALQDFTNGDANSIIDLSGVEVSDTAALQLLISARITLERAGRRLQLAAVSSAVKEASAALGLALPH
jgi:anti-anti-sigma factor